MIRTLLLLILICFTKLLSAQTISSDSAERIARADARHFRLDREHMKLYRKAKYNSSADYFKPTIADVSDTALLSNPDYVSAFRRAAYRKTKKRRTAGHYVLVAAEAYVAIVAIVFIVALRHFN